MFIWRLKQRDPLKAKLVAEVVELPVQPEHDSLRQPIDLWHKSYQSLTEARNHDLDAAQRSLKSDQLGRIN
jgi:hypothetical protein